MERQFATSRIVARNNRVALPGPKQLLALPPGETPANEGKLPRYCAAIIAYQGNNQWALALVHEALDGTFTPEWFLNLSQGEMLKLYTENSRFIIRKDLSQEDSLGDVSPQGPH